MLNDTEKKEVDNKEEEDSSDCNLSMNSELDITPPETMAYEATRVVMDRVSLLEDSAETHIKHMRDQMEKQHKNVPKSSKLSETSKKVAIDRLYKALTEAQ